ncbi:restriction endonuclease subunit S [Serinicoccus marinus]|uniref:restriction endonuclease subunit S n=1 Tax=Serinicoccus marinus TaxID=247333 RepID=UPI0024919FA1|nr:restriction endonuclease subunit S [Serinicoccus marinus]
MSLIDDLLMTLAPDGVPFYTLAEIATTVPGLSGKTKNDFSDGNARFVSYMNAFANLAVDQMAMDFVKVGPGEKQNELRKGDVVITGSSESVDEIGMSSVVIEEPAEALYLNSFCFALRFENSALLLPGFSKYLFRSNVVRDQIRRSASGVTRINISKPRFMKVRIPVPPIEVQREIVRILDQFTQLEAELEAELEARRRQYDHYAGLLLTNDENVLRVKFGDVATIVRGASPRPIQKFITDASDGVPWIKIGDVPARGKYITGAAQCVTPEGAAKSRRVSAGDFVLSNSMSFGRPYISKIEGYIHDGWLAISDFDASFAPDYLYYLLRSAPIQEEFARRAGAGTVKNLNAEIVRSVEVPVPSMERQYRVVDLLDKFDALVNDLSTGLPAELGARRKQYEYYRDKLLTFTEAK